jgi:uncharacterized protein
LDLLAIEEFAKYVLEDDTTGHDWKHALRVEKNAQKIMPPELPQEDIEIIRASCWLHDTIDEKIADLKRQTVMDVQKLLQENEATQKQIEEILFIIQNLSFSKNITEKIELNLLGQVVQDADRLDAIGAIGIARTFYYGGSKGNPIYDEEKPRSQEELTVDNYRKPTSVINHFYEKLLLLEQQMNTELGTKEAKKRTRFMRDFLKQFYSEIYDV